MDKRTFQQAMSYLAAAYDMELPRERAAVYWDQLGGLHADPFRVAVKVAVRADARFPSVARLRELYREELRRRATNQGPPALPRLTDTDRERGRAFIRELRQRIRRTP